ncbi:hypothetical protein CXB51_022364 [Gossypium anomalum]|uniref:Glycoside hydrolase family 19 catalytic domain-containing protein n=1 Tax=Gossypium anomalum TaxID=47600 RepID=A0A8J5YJQ5_9ROSI|nr:hypothetical protein CXB51_022364 [Gossypium anomalum]
MAALMAVANGQESVKPLLKAKLCDKGWECKGWSQFCCNQTILIISKLINWRTFFAKRNTTRWHMRLGSGITILSLRLRLSISLMVLVPTGGKLQSTKEVAAFLGQVGSKTSCKWLWSGNWGTIGLGSMLQQGKGVLANCIVMITTNSPTLALLVFLTMAGCLAYLLNYNYGETGEALKVDLLNHPEYIENNATLSFQAAIWRWMTPVKKPNRRPTMCLSATGTDQERHVGQAVPVGKREAGPHEVLTCENKSLSLYLLLLHHHHHLDLVLDLILGDSFLN